MHLQATGTLGTHSVTGALLGDKEIHLTDVDGFPINVPPSKYMLFTRHRDMPGIIGKLGSLLGSFNVNIASMQVGRKIVRGDAVMALSIDDPLPDGILEEIKKVDWYSGRVYSHTLILDCDFCDFEWSRGFTMSD